MILVFIHVAIALSSLGMVTTVLLAPSLLRLRLSYGFIGATLASGTYLVITAHGSMITACISGIAYLAIAVLGVYIARVRLARLLRTVPEHQE